MEVNKYLRYTLATLLLAGASATYAQDGPLRGSVVVNGKYLPDVIRQDRKNTLPRVYSFPMKTKTLPWEKKGVTTPFNPGFTPMLVTGWETTRAVRRYDGYVNLWAGSWLNSAVSAGYRILEDDTNSLGVWLQHTSTSLWHPEMTDLSHDIRRKRYDEALGVDYAHTFADKGRLSMLLDYRLGYFNYYGYYAPALDGMEVSKAPSQTLNDVAARFGWSSLLQGDVRYDAALSLRYFGLRALYEPLLFDSSNMPHSRLNHLKGEKETHLQLDGGVTYDLDSSSSLGVRAQGDALFYSVPMWRERDIDDYGNLSLRPGYRLARGNTDINIGARLDFTFGAGPKGGRFSVFHPAPDVRVDFKSGLAGMFLHVGGGVELNTLSSRFTRDYYACPALISTTPAYSPIDADLGVSFGPFSGLTATLSFGYKYTRHVPYEGLYTYWLNHFRPQAADGVSILSPMEATDMTVKGWRLRTEVNYTLSDMVRIGMDASYQPQDGERGYVNGIDRSRWTLAASACVRPVKKLEIEARYNYRGLRRVYCPAVQALDEGGSITIDGSTMRHSVQAMHLPDITDVSLRAAYDITPSLTVSIQGDNLLNRKIELLPDVRSQGVNILAGLQFTF